MDIAAPDLLNFYAAPLGQHAAKVLGARIAGWWPDLSGQRVLTAGYGTPLEPALLPLTPLSLCHFIPARLADVASVASGGREVLTDDTLMPLDSEVMDRVILLHRLEHARRQDRTFREVWRVLKPGGRLIVVVPSAFGLWARTPTTPFAKGTAFTGLRLAATLSEQLFVLERMRNALFFPPHSALKWSRLPTGGVLIAEAQKLGGPAHLLQSASPALKQRQTAQETAAFEAKQETRSRDNGR
ncbi:MAG: class I SAM-dependent methyltransferase [Alphaproteobacteria bacterium]|jgi:SAM-dependent methyltransferase